MKILTNGVAAFIITVVLLTGHLLYADSVVRDTVTKYYSISPSAFIGQNYIVNYYINHSSLYDPMAGSQFYAPLNLPDGAVVTEFKVWLSDSDAASDMDAIMMRTILEFGGSNQMAHVTSSGDLGNQVLTDTIIENSIIDNSLYKYGVDITLVANGTAHRLYSMRIKYLEIGLSIYEHEATQPQKHQPNVTSHPVPFSNTTAIDYQIQTKTDVNVTVYDEAGRLIKTLVDNIMQPGSYTARWDGRDSEGRKVPAGSYFCIVKTNGSSTTKVVHIK